MFELLLSAFCAYSNAKLAMRKGQNTVIWAVITVVAFFMAYFVGSLVMILIFYKGSLTTEPTEMAKQMQAFLEERPMIVITIMFFGLGGYLLPRFLLERMKDVKRDS